MKISVLLIFLITVINLSGCNSKNNNYTSKFHGVIAGIHEYDDYCAISLGNGWVNKVNINDCKIVDIGDKVLVITKNANGETETARVQKLKPNLP